MQTGQLAHAFAEIGSPSLHRRERRPVAIAAYAVRSDRSVLNITIVDLSVDGCGISCATALTVGERVKLSIIGQGTVDAVVRWTDGTAAGLSFGVSGTGEAARQMRVHQRVCVDGQVTMRRAGRAKFSVHVYDLSPEGCKAEFVERPQLGEQLWIKFDGLEALEAAVRWIAGAKAGLRFVRPLHVAVFDLVLARLGSASGL